MKVPHVEALPLADALLLHLPRYTDERGYFVEVGRALLYERLGLPTFVQDNLSYSLRGVLRGLHFQRPPHAQAKLVSVIQGHIQDVLVDLRPSSPTYKRWHAIELSSDREYFTWLYVPIGFAHGFLVLSEAAWVLYRCSAYYVPEADGGYRWDDPTFGISWKLEGSPRLSPKDANLPYFSEAENPFRSL
ncbi:MAG: dTDP-4-dehydrorhamnose 3,5-epimerase [Bacteroidia bacterium]|nr:dTDP-4-dehydrorhamnose 3,5-epimerase [Bacteroidia bacterium]MDW8088623.1 dTDP-4-dehydrorhamnose 3,5-epimerase [Bacteroidia bacterium]